MRKVASSTIAIVLILAAVIVIRTCTGSSQQISSTSLPLVHFDSQDALNHFAGAIRIQTISRPLQPSDSVSMGEFRTYLEQCFPLMHTTLHREIYGRNALLFTWTGRDPTLAPIVLMAHMDVVPVDQTSLQRWSHPPFSGDIVDGFVWGRGAMDDKSALMAYLEATEALLKISFQPRRTIYFSFGDDEENDGHGTEAIVALLKSREIHPLFVLDEGGQIARDSIPGVHADVALISVAEKGIASFRLTVNSEGGHSSRPPAHTAVGILSRAVARLEDHQMPARITPVIAELMNAAAPKMELDRRIMSRNQWLLGRLLRRSLADTIAGNAMVRTTTAITMFNAGVKDNVLPTQAVAVVNFRILPGDTVKSTKEHVINAIDDKNVQVCIYGDLAANPTPIAPRDTDAYRSLLQTVHQFFPQALLVPNLLTARTDSAQYYSITQNVYKFFPAIRDKEDNERLHGVNERFSTADYLRAVEFMAALMQRESI